MCSCCVINVSLQVEKVTLPLSFIPSPLYILIPQISHFLLSHVIPQVSILDYVTIQKNKALNKVIYNNCTLGGQYLCTLVH